MKDQPDLESRGHEIVGQFEPGGRREPIGGLEFNNHFLVHEHIDALPRDDLVLEPHIDAYFAFNHMPASPENLGEGSSIYRL